MTIIRQLMSADVRTCRPSDSLNEVAQILWESDCGVVPVVDEQGRVLGMITDRDACMAAYTRGAPLTELRAYDAMSAGAARCQPADDLESALRTMAARQVHRLPVVDEHERVVGVLSLSDAFRAVASLKGAARQRLALQVVAAAAAITRPRAMSCALPGAEAQPVASELAYEAR